VVPADDKRNARLGAPTFTDKVMNLDRFDRT
jgi:hypothetical protein